MGEATEGPHGPRSCRLIAGAAQSTPCKRAPALHLSGHTGGSPTGPHQPKLEAIQALHRRADETLSRYQRPIETVSSVLGRPAFFYGMVLVVTVWMLRNVFFPRFAVAPFDPAPFVWLQGLVGLGALLTTISVLITQTRQGQLAEQRAQLDLHVSLLTEQKIATLVALVEELRRAPPDVTNRHDAQATAMEQSTDLHAILNALETVPEPPPVDARFRLRGGFRPMQRREHARVWGALLLRW